MHVVAASGSEELADFLINLGADPNVVDCDGDSPLHWACTNDYPKVVRKLLEKGADIEGVNDVNCLRECIDLICVCNVEWKHAFSGSLLGRKC